MPDAIAADPSVLGGGSIRAVALSSLPLLHRRYWHLAMHHGWCPPPARECVWTVLLADIRMARHFLTADGDADHGGLYFAAHACSHVCPPFLSLFSENGAQATLARDSRCV